MSSEEIPKDVILYKTLLCRKWQYLGFCPTGPSCTFAHGHAEIKFGGRGKHVEKICHFYGTKRGCKKGDACPFQHVNLEVNYAKDFVENGEKFDNHLNKLEDDLREMRRKMLEMLKMNERLHQKTFVLERENRSLKRSRMEPSNDRKKQKNMSQTADTE